MTKMSNKIMTAEIIIIVIFAASTMLAAVLAIHNISELSDTRIRYNAAKDLMTDLEQQNRTLRDKTSELSRELEVERTNCKMLERIILDYDESAATSQQAEQEECEIEADDDLHANAESLPLPGGHTNVISGMPYTTITDKKSEQWALQLQAFTGKYGIRCYFDGEHIYFLAAMGSAYGREIGTAFRVTLKCGTELYVMLGEFKDDGTDPNFFGHPTKHADGYDVTCVLEFIYDAEHINSKALQAGNFCNIECFGGLHGDGGDIARIEYLGRKWKP